MIAVLHSGGLDSSILLHHYLQAGSEVLPVSVFYNQRHSIELISATDFREEMRYRYGGQLHQPIEIDLSNAFRYSGSVLIDRSEPVPHGHYEHESMKATVVPNRNMMMIAAAASVASAKGCKAVATAVHAGDHAIYPDCRPEFISYLRFALQISLDGFDIYTPFIHISKTEIARWGKRYYSPVHRTYSCYEGGELHCGRCGTCTERREALLEGFGSDPTIYKQGAL